MPHVDYSKQLYSEGVIRDTRRLQCPILEHGVEFKCKLEQIIELLHFLKFRYKNKCVPLRIVLLEIA